MTKTTIRKMNQTTPKKWPLRIWMIPLIGGIVTLVGLLLPGAYLDLGGVQTYIWTWGLAYLHTDIPDYTFFEMTTNDAILIPSIAYSLPILVGCIGLFIAAIRERGTPGKNGALLGAMSIMIISAIIGWIFFAESEMSPPGSSLWDVMHIGFGVIGPIVGGIISLVGSSCSIYANSHYTRDDLSASMSDTDRTFHHKKYRCMNCGSKTSKLAFQPDECLKCGGSVFQVL